MATYAQHDSDPALPALVARLRTAVQALEELREPVDAGAPWPLSAVFGAEPEARWGPPELLAHVAEMMRYWLGEIERVLDGASSGDEAVPFGRVESDRLRIALIDMDRRLPTRELYTRITAEADRIAARLAQLSRDDAGRRGRHPRYGETDVAAIVEHHIVGHLERHTAQLREILTSRRT
jgi:hypothetical protein